MIGLGESEAADRLAAGQRRQIAPLLLDGAELMDRQHDERGLHAHHRAEARIDALDLARDEPIAHVIEAAAAELLRDRRAEQAERAHFAEDRGIGALVPKCLDDARRELALRVIARGVAHHPFFRRQLLIEQQRIVPFEIRGRHVCQALHSHDAREHRINARSRP